jgi:hypothetical protein
VVSRIRLKRIEGERVTLHFSPDYTERARRIGALVEAAHRFLAGWLEVEAHTTVSVLRRENWRHLRRAPYGYPHSNPTRATIYVPATYPPPWLQRARALYHAAPEPLQQRLSARPAELDRHIAGIYDLAVVHELGHLFIHHLQLALGPQWLHELIANLFATAFFVEERPDLAETWLAWAEIQSSQEAPHRTREAYEANFATLTFANANYYQGRFNQLALRLWQRHGRAIAPPLIAQFSLRPGEVRARLQQVAPLHEWEL